MILVLPILLLLQWFICKACAFVAREYYVTFFVHCAVQSREYRLLTRQLHACSAEYMGLLKSDRDVMH